MCNAMTEEFELIEVFGKKVLFTPARVDRNTVPGNIHVYEIRHGDDGDPCEIAEAILVNHYGTILSLFDLKDKLTDTSLVGKAYKEIDYNELNFLVDGVTIQEYLRA